MATAAAQVSEGLWVARGTLTGVGVGTAEEITGLPPTGAVLRLDSKLTAGTATSIDPVLNKDGGSSANLVVVQATDSADRVAPETATWVSEAGFATYTNTEDADKSLYYWPKPDAASDGVVSFEIHFQTGWGSSGRV